MQDNALARIKLPDEERNFQIDQVIARGGNDRAGLDGVGLVEHAVHSGVADQHGHAEPVRRRHELAVAGLFNDHHPFFVAHQLLDDAEADVAQAADDHVTAVGDTPDFEGAASRARRR